MSINLGQDEKIWNNEWEQLTPDSEIKMWDFYGLRQWISKFIPRYGKVVEAGCGLGRYVFYFSRMGIDIEGIDFSKSSIDYLNEWKKKNDFNVIFKNENVSKLDYEECSLSGYISLGVIEHFIEGPKKALDEAYRVLRPGGIAIITTPNVSFIIYLKKFKKLFKNSIKKIIGKKVINEPFYQYWYRPGKLKKFIEASGFKVIRNKGADLLFAFFEKGSYSEKKIKEGTFGYWFSDRFENTFLSYFGSQSLAISIKTAEVMHCFLCGKLEANIKSLDIFDVPVCNKCSENKLAGYYKKNSICKYSTSYFINPTIMDVRKCNCDFCGKDYMTCEIFEDYGFNKDVCKDCLKINEINILLSNEFVKPVWRKRINNN